MIIMHCVNNDNDFVLYYPIEQGYFNELFWDLTEIFCIFKTKKAISAENTLSNINVHSCITHDFIINAINLICNGAPDEYFNYIIEFECFAIINSKKLNKYEIAEVVLIKQIMNYLRVLDAKSFWNIANKMCSRDLSSDIFDKLDTVFQNIED